MNCRIFACFLVIVGMSCHDKQRYPYAIRDFPDRYQPYLVTILNTGIAGFSKEEEYVGAKFSIGYNYIMVSGGFAGIFTTRVEIANM